MKNVIFANGILRSFTYLALFESIVAQRLIVSNLIGMDLWIFFSFIYFVAFRAVITEQSSYCVSYDIINFLLHIQEQWAMRLVDAMECYSFF